MGWLKLRGRLMHYAGQASQFFAIKFSAPGDRPIGVSIESDVIAVKGIPFRIGVDAPGDVEIWSLTIDEMFREQNFK